MNNRAISSLIAVIILIGATVSMAGAIIFYAEKTIFTVRESSEGIAESALEKLGSKIKLVDAHFREGEFGPRETIELSFINTGSKIDKTEVFMVVKTLNGEEERVLQEFAEEIEENEEFHNTISYSPPLDGEIIYFVIYTYFGNERSNLKFIPAGFSENENKNQGQGIVRRK